jgi:hypothetical protein
MLRITGTASMLRMASISGEKLVLDMRGRFAWF